VRFEPTPLDGTFVVRPDVHEDERGSFARTWDGEEFAQRGLSPRLVQCSTSWNRSAGTLRGLHHQEAPHEEEKLVRCTAGAIFDVAVDLRPGSATFLGWFGVELTAQNRLALYIPKGCAHGFLTLEDGSEVLYQMSEPHVPDAGRGVRWDDPAFGIRWPLAPSVINERDRSWPMVRVEAPS
jgi:dTDP-4-dehydrorhamnose 3,5-epimerase